MSEEKITNEITDGIIWKQLLIFFFPIVIGTFFQQLYNTVDAVIVGRFVGKQALASVGGSASVLSNLVIGFFTGLSAGAAVIIAQYCGAKDKKNLRTGLHTAYAFSIVSSIIISVSGYLLTPWMLATMHTPADVFSDSVLYLRIYFIGIIFVLIYNMGSSILRAIGDSKRPLYFLIISCFINIILDIFMVVVLRMGIAGAAIATVISQAVSAVLVTRALMRSYTILKLELRAIRMDSKMIKAELKIGLPSGLQPLMYSVTNIIIQTTINNFGTDTAAAWAAYGKLDAIFWTICGAFGISITTFAGQNYGAKKYARVKKSVWVCLLMAIAAAFCMIIFFMVGCRPLFSIFTSDSAVIDIGVYMLQLIMPSYIIYVFVEIYSGALRGISDVFIPTLITLGGVCFVRIPWILIMIPIHNEVSTVLWSYPLAWAITALFMVPYYFYRKKRKLKE